MKKIIMMALLFTNISFAKSLQSSSAVKKRTIGPLPARVKRSKAKKADLKAKKKRAKKRVKKRRAKKND